MEVIEKYPPSRRLDHPDFGTVCKTSFAQGTITEFKEVDESLKEVLRWTESRPTPDPDVPMENKDIAVESMVKVKIDGVESELIPIFCHPKVNYWDDEDPISPVLATDFNEEQGCHKLAWQSFRVDDEVAVMLKEGKPVAVVGFADGMPRIGEAIFQMEYDTIGGDSKIYQWQPGLRGPAIPQEGKGYPYGTFNVDNKGPDDLSLGLKTEALKICDTGEKTVEATDTQLIYYFRYVVVDGIPGYTVEPNTVTTTYKVKRRYVEYLISVGPFLYILQLLHNNITTTITNSAVGEKVYNYTDCTAPTICWGYYVIENINVNAVKSEVSMLSKIYSDKTKEEAIEMGKTHESLDLFPPDTGGFYFLNYPVWYQFFWVYDYVEGREIKAVNPSFSPDNPLWNPAFNFSGFRGADWSGWIFQPDWSIRLFTSYLQEFFTTDGTVADDGEHPNPNQIDPSTLKIFTRPHTKAELQAAGMWPA